LQAHPLPRRSRARLQVGLHFHDSPRRAHSIAAQGGINAAKNYRGDGDSIHRLFYDTVKGGDFRSREGNVHRLAQVSVDIIDQMVAQGVPFAREYGGLLDNRSFGGAQVSRTFYARGQTGQQLLLGAYQQLARQIGLGGVRLFNRVELVDTVVIDGRCAGIVTRPDDRRDPIARRRRSGAGNRRLRQRLLPLDKRDELQRHRGVAARTSARTSPTRATRRSTRRASRKPTTRSRS
jgi:succinate dehydrogenase/fumarate reductase flavoprotein subunit